MPNLLIKNPTGDECLGSFALNGTTGKAHRFDHPPSAHSPLRTTVWGFSSSPHTEGAYGFSHRRLQRGWDSNPR